MSVCVSLLLNLSSHTHTHTHHPHTHSTISKLHMCSLLSSAPVLQSGITESWKGPTPCRLLHLGRLINPPLLWLDPHKDRFPFQLLTHTNTERHTSINGLFCPVHFVGCVCETRKKGRVRPLLVNGSLMGKVCVCC